ncbi:MAG: NAD(P)H-binding protein [Gammaproteobacteria bacterium]|nr:NAD(P)H-binding protein [Gammaproteobacteria bacterium]
MKIAITGANSSVGKNLLTQISKDPSLEAMAGVRSESAFTSLPESDRIHPRTISYGDVHDLSAAFQDCDVVVHLAGILIETKHSKYESANVDATAAVVKAAQQAGAKHLIFVSVVGADIKSTNRYFKTKGDAEQLIANSGISATILRTPLLLGPGTAGADSVKWAASQTKAKLLGGGNYTMHPLDVNDLSQAILNCSRNQVDEVRTLELVGPEGILYRDLISKLAELKGNDITIASVPIWTAKLGAAIGSRLKGGGITPAVIDVITIDETVAHNGADELGVNLTPLQQTLTNILEQS